MPEVHTLFTRNNPFHFHYTAPDTHPDVEGLFTSLFFYSVTTASRCKKERKKEKKKERYIPSFQSFWMTFSSKPKHLIVVFLFSFLFFIYFHKSTFQGHYLKWKTAFHTFLLDLALLLFINRLPQIWWKLPNNDTENCKQDWNRVSSL